MEIDSPAWVAFAAAGDLAELRLLPVPKMLQMVGLTREARQARQTVAAADQLAEMFRPSESRD
jgi:hypothetical protein